MVPVDENPSEFDGLLEELLRRMLSVLELLGGEGQLVQIASDQSVFV
jgi:hypothetical protein